eukprot:TRINITY_DN9098_c0_g2_i4.p1 TRINITY_DN9098_c0_g2~~TRINITY_DN9098_c0_g2_i4.p1  ORF type:complete len:592 (-),score=47.50 TRINITY_DN9098_c0_g2_i4:380-2053(-)
MLSVVLLSISAYNLVNAQVQTIDETPCSSQLAEFQTQCAVDSKIEGLQGFRNQVDDTLALCCAEEDCCSKFRSLLQNECFQCEDIVEETRIITLYMALCETVLTVPMCMFQQKVPQQESQCTMLGFNLVSLCGNLKQDLKYNADGYSCCWENDCCDIARDYLSGDCNQECVADNDVVVVQAAGDIIARMWRSACMLPDDLELCSKIQVMSVGQQELVLPGVAEEKNTGVQGTAVQNEVAGSVSPTLLSSCTEVDVQNFGFDGLAIRVENLHNFCAEKSKAINTPAENLCCDHVEEVLQVACEYYSSCSSTPQEILGLVTPSIIQQWIDPTSSFSCTPPSITQTCDIPKALQLITQKEDNEQTENRNRTVDFTGIQGLDGQAVILMSAGNDDLLSIQQRFFEQKQAEVEEKNLTVFDILKMAPYFRDFYKEVQLLNLEERLFDYPMTVLAINQSTYQLLLERIPEYHGTEWNRTILSHITLSSTPANGIPIGDQQNLQTLSGSFVIVSRSSEDNIIVQGCCSEHNYARHIASVEAINGALWTVDNAIYPPGVAEKVYG